MTEPEPFHLNRTGIVTEHAQSEHVRDAYDMAKEKLGEGTYGTVCFAKSKFTGAERAIKQISKANVKDLAQFRTEISIMKTLDHPNIIKLFETYEDKENIYLVMEICTGG